MQKIPVRRDEILIDKNRLKIVTWQCKLAPQLRRHVAARFFPNPIPKFGRSFQQARNIQPKNYVSKKT
jgi:hypothetical protein